MSRPPRRSETRISAAGAYLGRMLRNQPDIPPQAAQAFVADMRAFFRETSQLKQDEIAARQCWALQAFQGPREKKLRLTDVKQMFLQMRDHA